MWSRHAHLDILKKEITLINRNHVCFTCPWPNMMDLKKYLCLSIGFRVYPIWYTIHNIRHHDRCMCSNVLTTPLQGHLLISERWLYSQGSQRDVVYLGWPIAPSYMSPNGGLRGLSQWVQWAQINFGDLTPYLTYGCIHAQKAAEASRRAAT